MAMAVSLASARWAARKLSAIASFEVGPCARKVVATWNL
jgi:hypothetical protein